MDTYADQLVTRRAYENAYTKGKLHNASAKNNNGYVPTKVDDINFVNRSFLIPKIQREKSQGNKLYRTPKTPPPDKMLQMERSFTLDCIAVGHLSDDYSIANPKLGSAIPPYDSQNDQHVKSYFKFHGLNELLKKTEQGDNHESIPGRLHDRFSSSGPGRIYLDLRNKFGNGHHQEVYEGHSRFQGSHLRQMFSYNNNFGYRRNIPSLRQQPSTFLTDLKWLVHLKNEYKNSYSPTEIQKHYEQTYVLGNPFHDIDDQGQTDYRDFHTRVRYQVTVRLSASSQVQFPGSLYINVLSRQYDTGFVQLNKSNVLITDEKKEVAKTCNSIVSIMSTAKTIEEPELLEDVKLFQKGKSYSFLFEERDVRTVQGILLSHDGKEGASVNIDHVLLEVHKANERKVFRFPVEGLLNHGKQDEKCQNIKEKFGTKKCVALFPNEKPKFEYSIVTQPQSFSPVEYKIQLQCNVIDPSAPVQYFIRFYGTELPIGGRVVMKLLGSSDETSTFKLSSHKGVFRIREKDVGEIKAVYLKYDKKAQTLNDWFIEKIEVYKENTPTTRFDVNEVIKTMHERTYKDRLMLDDEESSQENRVSNSRPTFSGKIRLQLHGDRCSSEQINLKDAELDEDKVTFSFQHVAANVGNVKQVSLKFIGNSQSTCHIKHVSVSSSKGTFEREVDVLVKHGDEIQIPDSFEVDDLPKKNVQPKLLVKLIGKDNQTDYFALEDPEKAEDGDRFGKTMSDIGEVESICIKYQGAANTDLSLTSIDVIDPKGTSYKFAIEGELKNGEAREFETPVVTVREQEEEEEEKPRIEAARAQRRAERAEVARKAEEEKQAKKSHGKENIKKVEAVSKFVSMRGALHKLYIESGDETNNADYSNVYIQLHGEKQSSQEVNLHAIRVNRDASDFMQNSTDEFNLRATNLGKITGMDVRIEDDSNTQLHLKNITVVAPKSEKYVFPVDGVFNDGNNDGDVSQLKLIPNQRPKVFAKKRITPESNEGYRADDREEM